ncbi:hypothetical protein ACL03H_01045 [Saccharopolyspora sp. MS10]|uniref:hypothetical protein n=1 Tax=Saccharopolyspora sp. MS10 TaxID=3385973 RepID=UPI00399F4BF0
MGTAFAHSPNSHRAHSPIQATVSARKEVFPAMPSQHPVGSTYKPTRFMRHSLTGRNQEELEIPEKTNSLLAWEGKTWRNGYRVSDFVQAKAKEKAEDGRDRWIRPTGFSLNKRRYGDYPDAEPTAHQHGWFAYLNMGVPLIEERSDIVQPPPDVISEQIYVNRTDPVAVQWTNTVEFSISNTISWSLAGQVQLTFGAKTTASLQEQLQKSLQHSVQQKSSHTDIAHNHKDNVGSQTQDQTEKSTTDAATTTATGTATGTGELSAQLMLGITASVSGSLTTAWKQSSTLSGTIESRAVVRATQRRQVKRFDYQIPVVFGGYVALHYPEPVEFDSVRPVAGMDRAERKRVQTGDPSGRTTPAKHVRTVVHPIDILGLVEDGENFAQKGTAEVVSTLAGEHEVFELEQLQHGNRHHNNQEAPFYRT